MDDSLTSRQLSGLQPILDHAGRFSLQGKSALITGASRGIGAEIATVFAVAGADVVIVGRDAEGLEATRHAIAGKGRRRHVIQADLRTDSFVHIGKMYGITPGFSLIAGPNWQGEVPEGITEVFRASTNSAFIAPRIVMDDTAEDRQAIQPVLQQILLYPLAEYDGTMKSIDWNRSRNCRTRRPASRK